MEQPFLSQLSLLPMQEPPVSVCSFAQWAVTDEGECTEVALIGEDHQSSLCKTENFTSIVRTSLLPVQTKAGLHLDTVDAGGKVTCQNSQLLPTRGGGLPLISMRRSRSVPTKKKAIIIEEFKNIFTPEEELKLSSLWPLRRPSGHDASCLPQIDVDITPVVPEERKHVEHTVVGALASPSLSSNMAGHADPTVAPAAVSSPGRQRPLVVAVSARRPRLPRLPFRIARAIPKRHQQNTSDNCRTLSKTAPKEKQEETIEEPCTTERTTAGCLEQHSPTAVGKDEEDEVTVTDCTESSIEDTHFLSHSDTDVTDAFLQGHSMAERATLFLLEKFWQGPSASSDSSEEDTTFFGSKSGSVVACHTGTLEVSTIGENESRDNDTFDTEDYKDAEELPVVTAFSRASTSTSNENSISTTSTCSEEFNEEQEREDGCDIGQLNSTSDEEVKFFRSSSSGESGLTSIDPDRTEELRLETNTQEFSSMLESTNSVLSEEDLQGAVKSWMWNPFQCLP